MRARFRSSSSRKSRRNMVLFRVKSVCPFLPVFTPRSFFWICLVPHRHFCASRNWFSGSSSIFWVWLSTKKNSLLGAAIDTLSVCVWGLSCSVPTSFQTASTVFLCFCVLFWHVFSLMGLVTVARETDFLFRKKLFAYSFFVGWCCVGTDSNHKTGFQTIFHACGSSWNAKHIAPPSSSFFSPQFRPPASTPPRGNKFFDDLRKRHTVFPDPQKHEKTLCFRRYLEKPPCILAWKHWKIPKLAPLWSLSEP